MGNFPALSLQDLLELQSKQFGKKKENATERTQELEVKYLFIRICKRQKSFLEAQGENKSSFLLSS